MSQPPSAIRPWSTAANRVGASPSRRGVVVRVRRFVFRVPDAPRPLTASRAAAVPPRTVRISLSPMRRRSTADRLAITARNLAPMLGGSQGVRMDETEKNSLTEADAVVDVVVVGGGVAGLSGALTVARSRRSVLVVDSGEPRNAPASGVHGLLSRDGIAPRELLRAGQEEVIGTAGGSSRTGWWPSAVMANGSSWTPPGAGATVHGGCW